MSLKIAAALLAFALPMLVVAQDQTYTFDIPREELGAALRTFAKVSKQQVAFEDKEVAGKQSLALQGRYTAQEALERLLQGSGLTLRRGQSGLFIVRDPSRRTTDGAPAGKSSPAQPENDIAVVNDAGAGNEQGAVVLEEVLVTAQKREQRLIDVPISMVTLSAQDLKDREATDIDDLAFAIPGMSIQSGPNRRITLRGVSNISGDSSLIGMYVDEADVTSVSAAQLDLNTYDLERVEVLRGPQGTLYGEGSAGGTIRFITRSPNLHAFEMSSDIAAVFSQYGAPSQRINAMVNVPVVDDSLALRVAGTFDHEGGWIDQPAADRTNINDQNITDVRFKALWKPFAELSASAMAELHRNHRSTNVGEDQFGNYTQGFDLTTTPAVTDNFNLYNLTLTYDVSSMRLLSSSSYVSQDNVAGNYNAILELDPSGSPFLNIYVGSVAKKIQIATEEFRVADNSGGSWHWVAGGYFRHFLFDQNESAFLGPPGPLSAAFPVQLSNSTLSNSWAAFGDTSYLLAERLTLGTGLRYFDEDQGHETGAGTPRHTGKFHSLNPRAYAQLKLTDRFNLHASAAKGFRSGGFNSLGQPSFDPESVWTYELGLKSFFLDNRLSADIAVFHSDYTNYQVTGIPPQANPPVPTTSNAGSAKIDGVEWSFDWRPVDQWTLGLSGDWLESKFTRVNASHATYQVGDPLDLFPKYEIVATVQRDFRWGGRPGFLRLDYSHQGRETYRDRTQQEWYFNQSDIIRMLNFDLGLHWSDNLTFGLFAKNLLNDRGFTDPLSIEHTAARARPRTIGVEFGVALQ